MIYLIAYDLHAEGQDYEAIAHAIENLADSKNDFCRIQKSVWVIWSKLQSAHAILERLKPVMDSNDFCFVTEVTSNSDHVLGALEESQIRKMKNHWDEIRFF